MMPADDFDQAWKSATIATLPLPIWSQSDAWDEATIPPRPWVIKGYFLRGSVTLIAGPGSAGKSSLTVGWAIAAALGADLGRFVANDPLRVMLFNVEDDAEEQQRRLSAALRQHGRNPSDIAGRVIRCGPHDIGTLIERDPKSGEIFQTRAWDAVEALIASQRPDIVFLDPMVELHTSEENDNTALRAVVAKFRELARKHRVAVGIIHHTRKGATAGEVDSVRGASAVVGAARVVLTVATMTEEEADQLGIPKDQRRKFFRVDTPKSNYHQAHDAHWHELIEHELDNGELVTAAHPWTPAGAKSTPPETRVSLERLIDQGFEGQPWSPRLSGKLRSVKTPMMQVGIVTPSAQKQALADLWAAGYVTSEFWDTRRREWADGIRPQFAMPDIKWRDESDA